MRYLFYILAIFFSNDIFGQNNLDPKNFSYEKSLKTALLEKLNRYSKNDTSIINIKNAIALFEQSKAPIDRIKMSTGITYVLTNEDCYQLPCSSPQIYPAGLYEEENHEGSLKALRSRDSKEPVGLDYIQYYIENNINYGKTKAFSSLIKIRNSDLDAKWLVNKKEQVFIDETSVTFFRESKGWVTGISTGTNLLYEDIFIYLFRTEIENVPGEEILLFPARSKNKQEISTAAESSNQESNEDTKEIPATMLHCQYIKNSMYIERERNFYGNMIERIVNDPQMADYYHDKDFFIVATASFRNDLEIKYKGKDIWILPAKCDAIKYYLEIISSDYTYNKKVVTFTFMYPSEGVKGKAVFEKQGEEYALKKIEVYE